ncbi:MAG TPA: hypothetical protein PLH70_08395 [Bacteroidales bacterium]|nr:hypothetical protein [Bacteroidales bacterium]HPB57507.1 hypothetical protein [Bacteroidales bacterium]HPZ04245.1 hypothetical protein [Bacteroidales bacterium]HQB75803.1 hypothetical protein [Bacteroidales bacterium]
MKYLLKIKVLFLLLILSNALWAQDELDKILHLQRGPGLPNRYCVQTIFNKLDNSSFYFQDFLYKKVGLYLIDDDFNVKNGKGTIKYTFKKPVAGFGDIDVNAYRVYVQYTIFTIEDAIFVEKMDIWGHWESIADIFVLYYPSKVKVEYLKNNKSEVTSYFFTDRAVFSSEMLGGRLIGRIKVRSTTGKDHKQFLKDFEIEKQAYYFNIEKERQDSIREAEEMRQIELQKEMERKRLEEEKLKAFLLERETTIYNFSEISKRDYKNLLLQIQDVSNSFISNPHYSSFFISGVIKVEIDTNSVVTIDMDCVDSDSQLQINKLEDLLLNTIKVKAPQINGYFVNSAFTYDINISYQTGEAFFKIDEARNFIFSEPYPTDKVRNEIAMQYRYSEPGKYSVKYEITSNENIPPNSDIVLIDYKKKFKFPFHYIGMFALIVVSYFGF